MYTSTAQPLVCEVPYPRVPACECGCVGGFCSTSISGARVCDASAATRSSLGLLENRQVPYSAVLGIEAEVVVMLSAFAAGDLTEQELAVWVETHAVPLE